MNTYTQAQAARIFSRYWSPIAAGLDVAAHADAGFDAGEFSGPYHAELWSESYAVALDRVAHRLGVASSWLADAVDAHGYSSAEVVADINCGRRRPRPRYRRTRADKLLAAALATRAALYDRLRVIDARRNAVLDELNDIEERVRHLVNAGAGRRAA